MNWSEEQFAGLLARKAEPFHPPVNEAGWFATGRPPKVEMNKTEAAYDEHLRLLKTQGEVVWYRFEAIKLKLAPATTYTPDFIVLPKSGVLEMHEVKGFWRDDARVKIKVAASIFPFRFIAVTKTKSGWAEEEFS